MIGHNVASPAPSSCLPREQLHAEGTRGDHTGRRDDGGPLLPVQNAGQGEDARRGRERSTGNEDGGETRTKRKLALDAPRRPRPRDDAQFATPTGCSLTPPAVSPSDDALDSREPRNADFPRSRRPYSFPRHGTEDLYDEDVAAQPPPPLDRNRNRSPPWPSTTNRRSPPPAAYLSSDCEEDLFQTTPLVAPIGQRQRRVHDDGRGEVPQPQRAARRSEDEPARGGPPYREGRGGRNVSRVCASSVCPLVHLSVYAAVIVHAPLTLRSICVVGLLICLVRLPVGTLCLSSLSVGFLYLSVWSVCLAGRSICLVGQSVYLAGRSICLLGPSITPHTHTHARARARPPTPPTHPPTHTHTHTLISNVPMSKTEEE